MSTPLIAVLAGEHSGDLLGAGLLRELRQRYPDAEFIGVGGPLMQAQGLQSLVPMEDLAVMGIAEVVGRLPRLLRHRRLIVKTFSQRKPDVFIGIDAPDFNLPIAKRLKQQGIATVHYVSPSVWAWRQGRIHGIKQAVDHVLCLLPFEKAFYDQHQLAATFVGHPLADEIPLFPNKANARSQLHIEPTGQVIGLLPGSRAGEIARLAPVFIAAAQLLQARRPELRFIAPMISESRRQQFQQLLQQHGPQLAITVTEGQSRLVLEAADVVLLTSGTVTLEALLYKRPMVVAYRFAWLSFQLIKRLFKAKYFSLPNLLAGQSIVPEVVQEAVSAEHLADLLERQLDADNSKLEQQFLTIHQQLKINADQLSADVVSSFISK